MSEPQTEQIFKDSCAARELIWGSFHYCPLCFIGSDLDKVYPPQD
jgi:hypothetical protein